MRFQGSDSAGSGVRIPPPRQLRERATRRSFLASSAGATGAMLGAGLLGPAAAFGANPHTDRSPTPTTSRATLNGVTFALSFFGPGLDPSSITDFNGFVGVADVQGTGTATNPDGSTETLLYDTDMRFMSGSYVGKDGHVYKGTFAFV
jgi:hypothetical protein